MAHIYRLQVVEAELLGRHNEKTHVCCIGIVKMGDVDERAHIRCVDGDERVHVCCVDVVEVGDVDENQIQEILDFVIEKTPRPKGRVRTDGMIVPTGFERIRCPGDRVDPEDSEAQLAHVRIECLAAAYFPSSWKVYPYFA